MEENTAQRYFSDNSAAEPDAQFYLSQMFSLSQHRVSYFC